MSTRVQPVSNANFLGIHAWRRHFPSRQSLRHTIPVRLYNVRI